MRAVKHFASLLYFAVTFAVIALTLFFLITMSAKIFGTDGQYIIKNGNSTFIIGNKISEGYNVPATLTLQIPDSIPQNKYSLGVTAADSYPQINTSFLKDNKKAKAVNIYVVHPNRFVGSLSADGSGDRDYLHKQQSKFQFVKYDYLVDCLKY
jgi:hypothetical protein